MRLSELGKYGQDTAVLWHEAIARRKDNYVSSAFHKFIESLRDVKDLTIWLDNCAGQNKNWTFFTMMLYIINNPSYNMDRIRLKYLEPAHSFMASDTAHDRIKKQMRRTGKLFDFRDIVEAVTAAKCKPVPMTHNDFMD